MSDDQVLLPAEIGELLKLHESTVRRMLNAGELPSVRVGKRLRMTRRQVQNYLASNSSEKPAPRTKAKGKVILAAKDYA